MQLVASAAQWNLSLLHGDIGFSVYCTKTDASHNDFTTRYIENPGHTPRGCVHVRTLARADKGAILEDLALDLLDQ